MNKGAHKTVKLFFSTFFAWLMLLGAIAQGHTVEQMFASLEKEGREWELEVLFDAAYALPEMRNDADLPQPKREWLLGLPESEHGRIRNEIKTYLEQALKLEYSGKAAAYDLRYIDYESTPPDFPSLLNGGAYVRVRLSGQLLDNDAGEFKLGVTDFTELNFVVAIPSDDGESYVEVKPMNEAALFSMNTDGDSEVVDYGMGGVFWIGFRHVLVDSFGGLDHVLFIMALFLMQRRWRPLVAQSLVFTVAHSVSLGLATSGVIQVSQWSFAWLIEPVIAISIAVVALENIFSNKNALNEEGWQGAGRKRLAIIFAFGLIHGLGFAGGLAPILHHGDSFLLSLATANIGVECAQVFILLVAWVLTIRWWKSSAYRSLCNTLSLFIAAIGIWWAVERLVG